MKYSRACTEVLEIIRYFPQEEYLKIPSDVIAYYKNNMDPNYDFTINPNVDLSQQNISKEAYSIIISIFRDYFATDKQKAILINLLKQNQEKREEELREKYNPDFLSQRNLKDIQDSNTQKEKSSSEEAIQENGANISLIEYKNQKWYKKIFKMIKSFFDRKSKT